MRDAHISESRYGHPAIVRAKFIDSLLWGWLSGLRLFVFVVFVFAAAEDLLEEVFLFGCGWCLSGVVWCIAVRRGVVGDGANDWRARAGG
jgi:hypothetical protein